MRPDYAQVFRNTPAVDKYATVVYAPGSYSWHVDRRQRTYLRRLVSRQFGAHQPTQHDFACGTGRAIRMMRGLVRAAHGYDSSAAMLAEARAAGLDAALHELAEHGPLPQPVTGSGPALVTIFRLLLNAPDEVRNRAIGFAATVLQHHDTGVLVVENHGNRHSLRHFSARRHAGDPWFSELSHGDVRQLLGRHGFTLVAARACAVLPVGAYRRAWLRPIAQCIDAVLTRLPATWRIGTDVLYVARRGPVRRLS
jgi:SAM-dependent methyltransferase